MKKMLVCDYDQTLNFDLLTFYYNLKKVNEFRENENIFTLSTGRNFKSIMSEVRKYKISYDYLSCSDGMVLYNQYNQLLFASYIDPLVIEYLEKELKNNALIKSIDKMRAFGQMNYEDVIECFINTTSLENMKKLREILENNYPSIDVRCFFRMLYISNAINSKSLTIEKIKEIEHIADENIFTIGDHNNDVSMIKNYNGFCMPWATIKARRHSLKTYLTVGHLINDIQNESAKVRVKK